MGLYPQGASPYGVLDLAGNVWEWCLNKYDNPADTALGGESRRVLRGGSWDYDQDHARAAGRHYGHPGLRGDDLGFRVVRGAPI